MIDAVLLHSNHAFTWKAWHPEPILITGTVIAIGLYFQRSEVGKPRLAQIAAFLGGVAFVFVALGSPLDVGAGRLFSLHMLQHVILSTWAPPLLLLGLTGPMIEPLFRAPVLGRALRVLTHPLVGAPAFILNMWLWHVPAIYDVAVTEPLVHYTMHLSFLGTGLLFWWTLVSPLPGIHSISYGSRFFYILFSGFPMMILAFMLVASPSVLYDYYEAQPRLWGISAQTDQQIGGGIMGTLGELTMLIPFTIVFIRLLSDDESETESAA